MTGFSLPPSPGELRRRRERRQAILLLVGSIAVVLLVVGVLLIAFLARVELDPETLCPTDEPPAAQVAVLLDVTDPYNAVQRAFVTREILRLQESLPKHGQLALYALSAPAKARLEPQALLCNPGSGRDESWLWRNPEKLRRRWEEGFREPLAAMLEESFRARSARKSPLMEQIQAASVAAFDPAVVDRRLVIVSDMLQNSGDLRMYRGDLDFARFRSSPGFERLRCDLPGVAVRVLYVLRPESPFLQRKRSHVAFWERYFESCGARIERVDVVPGLAGAAGADQRGSVGGAGDTHGAG